MSETTDKFVKDVIDAEADIQRLEKQHEAIKEQKRECEQALAQAIMYLRELVCDVRNGQLRLG